MCVQLVTTFTSYRHGTLTTFTYCIMSYPPVRAKTFEPSYNTALKCLMYLSEDRRVAESRAFVILSGNTDKIKSWLEFVDRGEVGRREAAH